MIWVDYDGTLLPGYTHIGTDDVRIEITQDTTPNVLADEIMRRCGKFARIKLFKEATE